MNGKRGAGGNARLLAIEGNADTPPLLRSVHEQTRDIRFALRGTLSADNLMQLVRDSLDIFLDLGIGQSFQLIESLVESHLISS